MNMRNVKAGFVSFGEVNTPPEIIEKKAGEAEKLLKELGLDLVRTDPVHDDPQGNEAKRAIQELKSEEFDLLIVCIAGWIPSWAVIRITTEFAHKPMLLWGLTGSMQEGRLVSTAAQAGTTALRKVFEDLGYRYNLKSRPNYNYVCRGDSISNDLKSSRCFFETSVTTVFFSPR